MDNTDRTAVPENGRQVFEKRCAACHTIAREHRGLYPKFRNYTYQALMERIPTLGSMQLKMAPWSGSPQEAELLARYILSWYDNERESKREGE